MIGFWNMSHTDHGVTPTPLHQPAASHRTTRSNVDPAAGDGSASGARSRQQSCTLRSRRTHRSRRCVAPAVVYSLCGISTFTEVKDLSRSSSTRICNTVKHLHYFDWMFCFSCCSESTSISALFVSAGWILSFCFNLIFWLKYTRESTSVVITQEPAFCSPCIIRHTRRVAVFCRINPVLSEAAAIKSNVCAEERGRRFTVVCIMIQSKLSQRSPIKESETIKRRRAAPS